MKKSKSSISGRLFCAAFIMFCLCAGICLSNRTKAQHKLVADGKHQASHKISLEITERLQSQELQFATANEQESDKPVSLIVQFDDKKYKGKVRAMINSLLHSNGSKLKGEFNNLNASVVEMPLRAVKELASFDAVSFISLDKETEFLGHIENTAGATLMRSQTGNSTLDGRGIGIAIIDSGMYHDHKSFYGADGRNRIVAKVDFTGEGKDKDDFYGHGSHVAGIAAGGIRELPTTYKGIAPAANLINLRVLNAEGRGSSSALLNALNWILTNRTTYNIRVVNMSLGTLAVDSYRNDPLCRAVRRLVDAGIVCVAAAGNNGKNSDGQKIYGLIHSPGNEPSAITVGATDTKATDARSDDTIATFSSRGPTRSYEVDADQVKHYDNLIKPDLVAPGNQVVSTQAKDNLIIDENPTLDASSTTDDKRDMMLMNGTSMAAPVVSGAAALLLQANPTLTPNMVKTILMYTAQPLAGFDMFEQGAGQLNIEGAMRVAKLVRTTLTASTPLGSSLLTTTTEPTPQTTIAGHSFVWGQGIILDQTYATGIDIITKYQKVYGLGMLLGDATMLSNGMLLGDNTLVTNGMLLGDNILISNGMLLGDGYVFLANGMLLGDGRLLTDGILLGDGQLQSDGMLLGDGILLGDVYSQSSRAMINGDGGPCADCRH
jgi:serine protease AprX